MKRFALMPKDNELSLQTCRTLRANLIEHGWIEDQKTPELVIVVGGDGMMLRAIHHYIDLWKTVNFVGVHTGTLGFFTDFEVSEIDLLLELIHQNQFTLDSKSLLQVEIERTTGREVIYALNEFRIENPMRTQVLDLYIDQNYFETFKGNGLVLSTPSGSTAYNKSLGGAVIMPGVEAMQLTEIAPIRHNKYSSLNAPLIIPKDQEVLFQSSEWGSSILGIDHLIMSSKDIRQIKCRLGLRHIHFIRYRPHSFFRRIQKAFIFNQ